MVTRPSTATTRRPVIKRSVSGDGERRNALKIHCRFGKPISSTRIMMPNSQFRTTRLRSTTYATGNAPDDDTGLDMAADHPSGLLNINKLFIDYRQYEYW